MITKLIDFALNNRFLVIVFALLAIAGGSVAMTRLPIDAVPDVTNVQVQILTNAPALGPEEVERFITFPVETAMSGLPDIEQIRSVSKFGLSVVTVVFEEHVDIYFARQLVGERLSIAKEEIPEQYGSPELGPISSGLGEIYQFQVKGEGKTPMELRTILDWFVAYQLRSVPGVVEVNTFGGELKTYEVQIDPARLVAYKLSITDVYDALMANNANAGGGYIEKSREQYLVSGQGLITSLHDIEDIVVSEDDDGTPVFVKNLATVAFAPQIRQGAVTRDGEGEAVIGIVMMLIGENSRVVSRRVDEKIGEIAKSLPPGVTIETFYDRTELVDRTIHTVQKNLLEGGIFVIVVLLLLLGNLRGGLIVASAIPLSMLIAFTAMVYFGVSGNLMSLGALDFGLIVDGSVVMIENVVRLQHEKRNHGRPRLDVVREAAHEVARPIVFAVGIIIIVYLPILSLTGIEGKMFKPMALTVIFALVASLVLALTVMPVLASLLLKPTGHEEKEPFLLRWAKRAHDPLLVRAANRRVATVLIAASVFAGSLVLVPFLGAEFVPSLDEGSIALQAWRIPSVSLAESIRQTGEIEKILKKFPEVTTVVSKTGRAEIATDPMGVEISDIIVMLKPHKQWVTAHDREGLVAAFDKELTSSLPGTIFSYSQPIELRVSELVAGVRSQVAIKIYGEDLELLKKTADQVVKVVSKVPGAAEVKAEQVAGLPVLRIQVRREAIARHGINVADVLSAVNAIGGLQAGEVVEGQRRFALQIRLAADARMDPDRIGNIPIAAPGGRLIPLAQLADLTIEDGPAQISRENIQRRITVELNVRGRDLAGFVGDAQKAIDRDVTLPAGYIVDWGGQFENLQAASKRLAIVVPLALFLIFVLLFATFNSVRIALLIYANVPVAISGGLVALFLRGMPFSISAAVGFIALFGVAVLNGVVLVSYIEKIRKEGATPEEAAMQGARVRLRPVLMTALVASLGFVPMAIATSAGAEVQRPLATVVIGGLITSTLLTLLVLPSVYPWFVEREQEVAL